MFITAAADIHGHLPEMAPCDMAVICGDIFPGEMEREPERQGKWFLSDFLPWAEQIECERIILIAGNHDYWIEANNQILLEEFAPSAGHKLVYLCDSGLMFHGLQIYGTPWVPPPARNKAFALEKVELKEKFAQIPQQVDLLITHTVPNNCNGLDCTEYEQRLWGSAELREAVEIRHIDCLIGGHIHAPKETVALMDWGDHHTTIINAACCDNHKEPLRKPLRICFGV